MKPHLSKLFIGIALLYAIFFSSHVSAQVNAASAQSQDLSKYKIKATGFVENKGQIVNQNYKPNTAVKYLFSNPGFNVQLRQTGFSYDTYTDVPDNSKTTQQETAAPKSRIHTQAFTRYYHRVDIELLGSNPQSQITAEGKSEVSYNYINSNVAQGGVSDVHYYTKVVYKNIYPNIDLEFFTSTKQTSIPLEYQFIVHAGGNPADIKLAYKGANKVGMSDGKLVVNVDAGDFNESIPSSYLKASGKAINVVYTTLGNNVFTFSLPKDIAINSDLVIDPTPNLLWGTYYGGSGDDEAYGIALDASNNVYVTGLTSSSSDIATSGEYKTTFGGNYDAFVAKFNSSGTTLDWGTYYGGSGNDEAYGIALDASDNIYITGFTTSSSGIATSGEYQTTYGGDYDAFVAKFNSSGTSLDWGTYYGGSGADYGWAIKLDASDNVYIAGQTSSSTGIATSGEYQTTYGGGGDAFVAKFNSGGTTLDWGTYYGGSGSDAAYGIALDASNDSYITGTTSSASDIATLGTFQTTNRGSYDAFIAELNSSGSSLVAATYYGGSGYDVAYGITLDTSDNAYITGQTQSNNLALSTNPYDTTYGEQGVTTFGDVLIAEFNSSLTTLNYGTYYGSETCGDDGPPPIPPQFYGYAITVDGCGNIYITGEVDQNGCTAAGMVTEGAYQTTINGGEYCYIAKFDPKLSGTAQLIWGTYYGGSGVANDYGEAIALDGSYNVYITGQTDFSSGIATSGEYQTTLGGSYDAYVAKFSNNSLPTADAGSNQTVCLDTLILIGGSPSASGGISPYSYSWSSNPSGLITSTSANPYVSADTDVATVYLLTVTDAESCTATASVTLTPDIISPAFTFKDTVCVGTNDTLTAELSGVTYSWDVSCALSYTSGCDGKCVVVTTDTPGYYMVALSVNDGVCTSPGNYQLIYFDSCTMGGDFELLKKSVNSDSSLLSSIEVYPTIINDQTSLNVIIPTGKSGVIDIYSLLGEKIQEFNLPQPSSQLSLSSNDLAEGLYIYRVTLNNNTVKIGKLIWRSHY